MQLFLKVIYEQVLIDRAYCNQNSKGLYLNLSEEAIFVVVMAV